MRGGEGRRGVGIEGGPANLKLAETLRCQNRSNLSFYCPFYISTTFSASIYRTVFSGLEAESEPEPELGPKLEPEVLVESFIARD